MKKQLMKVVVCLGIILAAFSVNKTSAKAYTTGTLSSDGHLYSNGRMVINDFVFDGTYTYYAQADGTPMKDRLTYHPDGVHIIYFDSKGHEVFSNFQYCPSVGYTCYFDSQGYIYKDQITFVDNEPYYLNADGKMEDRGWFRFANGVDYGYAFDDGSLNCSGFDYDPWGRVVFYHWNGMVARGLIADGNNYYSMSTDDGHYLGSFSTGNTNPLYGPSYYIVGVNMPAGEYFIANQGNGSAFTIYDSNNDVVRSDWSDQNLIFTAVPGETVWLFEGIATPNLASQAVNLSACNLNAKVGVHIGAGVYRITAATDPGEGRYYNLWNDSSFLNSVASSHEFTYDGETVEVRVSNGQMLDVCNAYVTYVGP